MRALIVLALLLAEDVAHAQPPCAGAERWVAFATTPAMDPPFVAAARAHLAAELSPRGIALCGPDEAPGTAGPPRARVDVEGRADGVLLVRVSDDATRTSSERALDLSGTAPAGRALAFGLAIDELLAARWMTAALETRATTLPVVAPTATPIPSEPRFAVGLSLAGQHFGRGLWMAGPALSLAHGGGRFSVGLQLGARGGTTLGAPHGQMTFTDLHARVGTRWRVARSGPWSVGPLVALELARVRVEGRANASGVASSGYGAAVVAWAGMRGAVRLGGPFAAAIEVGAGWAMRPVRGRDDGMDVGGVEGLVLGATLGTSLEF